MKPITALVFALLVGFAWLALALIAHFALGESEVAYYGLLGLSSMWFATCFIIATLTRHPRVTVVLESKKEDAP